MVYRFKGDTQQKEKKENDKVYHKHSECATTMCFYDEKAFQWDQCNAWYQHFSHFSRFDRNKGDIERKVCMDSVELKRVDGHLFRKMTTAQVIHLTNVYH